MFREIERGLRNEMTMMEAVSQWNSLKSECNSLGVHPEGIHFMSNVKSEFLINWGNEIEEFLT